MAIWFLALVSISLVGESTAAEDSGTLIHFGSLHCSACQQMQPAMDQLRAEGWNVRSIDTEKDPRTADRWRIQSIPTLIVLKEGREVDRIVGGRTFSELKKDLRAYQSVATPSNQATNPPRSGAVPERRTIAEDNNSLLGPNHPQFRSAYRINFDNVGSAYPHPSDANPLLGSNHPYHTSPIYRQPRNGSSEARIATAPNVERTSQSIYEVHPLLKGIRLPQLAECMAASVRIRVENPESMSVGSGTIIDVYGEESLVITCGHLFRDSDHRDQVFVELFSDGKPTKVRAKVVAFQVDEIDIGLVTFRQPFPVNFVSILPKGQRLQEEDPVLSIGCDRGANPSKRETIISKLNRYLGPANIEIAGAPTQGRSGGGLFDPKGRLIGVCRAADHDLDEGLFAGPEVIYAELAKHRLQRLFQPPH